MLFANNRDPDQTPHSAVADLGLHQLPISLLGSPDQSLVKFSKHQTHHSHWLENMTVVNTIDKNEVYTALKSKKLY